MKICVIALGSWGTAISNLLAFNGHKVVAYARNAEFVETLRREGENKKYLPNIKINSKIQLVFDIETALRDVDMVVSAVPTQSFRESLDSYRRYLSENVIFVNLAKGIEIMSGSTLSRVADLPNYVALSGPTHAEEVGDFHPSAIVAASECDEAARTVQRVFSNEFFRVYRSDDLRGVEIAGALKNVIALGAGIISGIGYGDNARAALITRGLYETAKFGVLQGADKMTFTGLAGVGDMIVTCSSRHSRNFRCGELIGRGRTPEQAIDEIGMVVEGIYTVRAVKLMLEELKKHHPSFEMPITEILYRVVYQDYSPTEAIKELMNRKYKHENE